MQGLVAAILCRAGPVLEALRLEGTAPQANPTTPPRRPREPSPSTPGDNKRQSRRLKAGQQALAGLRAHFRSRPRTIRSGHRHRGLARRTNLGGELFPPRSMGTPWHGDLGSAHHPADHARPQPLRQGHVPPDGLQTASLEGRRRKALIGTVGARICVLTSPWGDKLQNSLSLDILHSVALNIQDSHHHFFRGLERGVPLRVTDPPRFDVQACKRSTRCTRSKFSMPKPIYASRSCQS